MAVCLPANYLGSIPWLVWLFAAVAGLAVTFLKVVMAWWLSYLLCAGRHAQQVKCAIRLLSLDHSVLHAVSQPSDHLVEILS